MAANKNATTEVDYEGWNIKISPESHPAHSGTSSLSGSSSSQGHLPSLRRGEAWRGRSPSWSSSHNILCKKRRVSFLPQKHQRQQICSRCLLKEPGAKQDWKMHPPAVGFRSCSDDFISRMLPYATLTYFHYMLQSWFQINASGKKHSSLHASCGDNSVVIKQVLM